MDVVSQNSAKIQPGGVKVCLTCHERFWDNPDTHCSKDGTHLKEADLDPLAGSSLAEHYQVLELIGCGGWGLVYKARQQLLGRMAAIKILHQHHILDPEKVMRFKREAEAASQFNHPAIAAVYDYGVLNNGLPYIVMGYVEGRSLLEVIEQDGPLTIERALNVFIQISSALELAHERGVIHRDIKPHNVFLTKEKDEVKILDFGLAKLTSPEEGAPTLTQSGHTIGTPAYMSPEQCMGLKLDARSDIYSFGCVMYEALTGERAFDGTDAFDCMNMHMHGGVSFADKKVHDVLPEQLELCVLKTLEKNPVDRFQNAAELTQALRDIQRHASRRTRRTPFEKWIAALRKRLGGPKKTWKRLLLESTATVLMLGALIAMMVTSTNNLVQNANNDVNPADLWKRYYNKAGRFFDTDNFKDASINYKIALEQAKKLGPQDERLSKTVLRLEESLRREGKVGESKQIEQWFVSIKNSNYGLMYGTAQQNAEEIIQLSAQLQNKPDDHKIAERLAAVLNDQAARFFTDGRIDDGFDLVKQAIELEEKHLGQTHAEYAKSLSNMAYVYKLKGQSAKAEDLYKKALDIREKYLGDSNPLVGRSLRNLADFYLEKGQYDKAEELLLRSLEVYKKSSGSDSADYAWGLNNLGLALLAQGKREEARRYFDQALTGRTKLYGPQGLDVGRTLNNIGQLDLMEHKYKDAEQAYAKALRIYEKHLDADNPDTTNCAYNLASLYFTLAKPSEAEPLFKRVLNSLLRMHSTDPKLNSTYDHLLAIYQQEGRPDAIDALKTRMQDKDKE